MGCLTRYYLFHTVPEATCSTSRGRKNENGRIQGVSRGKWGFTLCVCVLVFKHACLLDGCCCRNESIASPHACSVLSVKVATDRESLAVIRVSNIISDLQGVQNTLRLLSYKTQFLFVCLFFFLSPEIKNLLISGSWLRHTAVQSAVFIQTNNTSTHSKQHKISLHRYLTPKLKSKFQNLKVKEI